MFLTGDRRGLHDIKVALRCSKIDINYPEAAKARAVVKTQA
jgi:hypothetical protein